MDRPAEPTIDLARIRQRRLRTDALTATEVATIRALLDVAFGPDDEDRFTEADWDHAVGGQHFLLELDGRIVAHAAVVEREIQVADRSLRTGYVEAVGTAPAEQGRGLGSRVIADVTAWIRDHFEFGALGTGRHRFYERLGWQAWVGPAYVRTPDGRRRTPDEDGYILVLRTPISLSVDLTASITCDWRAGDVW